MRHYAKKIAICYYKTPRTVVTDKHVKTIVKDIELYFLETEKESRKHSRKPLFINA